MCCDFCGNEVVDLALDRPTSLCSYECANEAFDMSLPVEDPDEYLSYEER